MATDTTPSSALASPSATTLKRGPLLSAGTLIGAGMGGFIDGIVLHQILQLHNMLSARIPPDTLVNAKINMFYDGLFHAGVWTMTAIGIALLFRASLRPDAVWSGRLFVGALLIGYGLFNFVEGVIDHQLLDLHHVWDAAPNPLPYDLAFLASGLLMIGVGAWLSRPHPHDRSAGTLRG